MALRMAQPWTHPKTGTIYLRQRTPEDLVAHLAGQTVTLPVANETRSTKIGETVQVSLRTKDPVEGKERHALADAALRRFWLRKRRSLEAAARGARNGVMNEPAPTMEWSTAISRFGEVAGASLIESGRPRSDAHRASIVAETAHIYDAVSAMLGPELGAGFLSIKASTAGVSPSGAQSTALETPSTTSVRALWESYSTARKEMLAPKTIRRYAPSLVSLAAYCGDRDINAITEEDIFRWAEHRRDADDILARVVNRNDLMAVKAVFEWAMTHQGGRLIRSNPATGIRLDEPRNLPTRERKFRAGEINAILRASLDQEVCSTNPSFSRAKRWCPWMAAYTGARIAELTALCAEDIWQEHGVWVMHFNTTKNRQPRMVPLHDHLIEQGLVQMRDTVGSGPLFYDLSRRRKTDAATSQAEHSAKKLAKWVREIAHLDPAVDPNHGWRHTFKSRALRLIDLRIRDHITGHAVGSIGRKYEHPEIQDIAEALAAFPRYEV